MTLGRHFVTALPRFDQKTGVVVSSHEYITRAIQQTVRQYTLRSVTLTEDSSVIGFKALFTHGAQTQTFEGAYNGRVWVYPKLRLLGDLEAEIKTKAAQMNASVSNIWFEDIDWLPKMLAQPEGGFLRASSYRTIFSATASGGELVSGSIDRVYRGSELELVIR